MNSVIEAQCDFTYCFGELRISHLTGELILPYFSNEAVELEQFINDHQRPAPVVINLERINYMDAIKYKYNG